jgi:hypothetical protein
LDNKIKATQYTRLHLVSIKKTIQDFKTIMDNQIIEFFLEPQGIMEFFNPFCFGVFIDFSYFDLFFDSLQSKFTLLQSKFFPAKMPFSKIQKKKLAGKKLLCKSLNLLCK